MLLRNISSRLTLSVLLISILVSQGIFTPVTPVQASPEHNYFGIIMTGKLLSNGQ